MVHELFDPALGASIEGGGNGHGESESASVVPEASRAISVLRSLGAAVVHDLHTNGKASAGRLRNVVDGLEDSDSLREVVRSIPRLQSEVATAALARPDLDEAHRAQIVRLLEDLAAVHAELVERWSAKECEQRIEILAEGFHDLRSPLTSVLFLSEALFGGYAGDMSESQANQARLIYSATLTVLNIVENVLASHQLSTRQENTKRSPFSVTSVREEVERVTRPLAAMSRLGLSFEQDCYSARLGDADVVRRILLNLVSNAIAYTDEGEVEVRLFESGDRLYLRVQDTGPGIEEGRLKRLVRSSSSDLSMVTEIRRSGNRRFSGAGLGLSICRRLAGMAGGRITVDSELGRGSCFEVELPFPALEGLCGPAASERAEAAASV